MDELSDKLNGIPAGCSVGNLTLNHIMYADDLCCFSASASGLEDLLNVCSDYAKSHSIVFNCRKTVGLIFCTKNMKVFQNDNVTIDDYKVKFVSRVSYLGVHLNSNLCDDDQSTTTR